MYCPACGNSVSQSLSYCNQCGARLGAADDVRRLPGPGFNGLLAIVLGLPFVGLAMALVLIAALKNGLGFRDDFIFGIVFLVFVLLALAETAFAAMLLSRSRIPKASKPKQENDPREMNGSDLRGLGSPTFDPIDVGSVTDHTTRTLGKVEREK